jgi:hypothetical protein
MALTVAASGGQNGMHSSNRMESSSLLSITADTSYPTGGYTGLAASLADYLPAGATITGIMQQSHFSGYHVFWDRANDKLQFYAAAGTEVPNLTDIHAVSGEIRVTFV